jgi:hypothetical protein
MLELVPEFVELYYVFTIFYKFYGVNSNYLKSLSPETPFVYYSSKKSIFFTSTLAFD